MYTKNIFFNSFYIFLVVIFTSCATKNIEITKYNKEITQSQNIDDVCKSKYETKRISVGVVEFTNNSNLDMANVKSKKANHTIGISTTSPNFGIKNEKESINRQVDPKLSKAFISQVEQMLLQTGAIDLYSRSDLGKIDDELKLQDSGLLNPNSIVEFGLTSGVKYIVTGSIDYINHNFKNYSKYTNVARDISHHTDNKDFKTLTSVAHLATMFLDGTKIKTAVTIKIIDVATGKIIFSKQTKKNTTLSGNKKPSYNELVGAVKSCISDALPKLQPELQKHFELTGYITQAKTNENENETVVQINLGNIDQIQEGQEFTLILTKKIYNPLTQKNTCNLTATDTVFTVTNKIEQNSAWLKTDDKNNIKLYQLLRRTK